MSEGIAHAVVQLVYVYGDYGSSCDDDSEIGPYLLILRSQRELLYYKVVVKVEVDAEKDDENGDDHFDINAVIVTYAVAPYGEASRTCG